MKRILLAGLMSLGVGCLMPAFNAATFFYFTSAVGSDRDESRFYRAVTGSGGGSRGANNEFDGESGIVGLFLQQ